MGASLRSSSNDEGPSRVWMALLEQHSPSSPVFHNLRRFIDAVPLLPLPQGCLYTVTPWQQQMPIRTASDFLIIIIKIVTQPLYESRMNWVHDPAPPTSRRPVLEFADTPAPAIMKESPGAPSTQPKHKKSRRRRRRRTNRAANQNSALRSTAPVTPDERWANENSASQRATRPKSAANDLPEMRSTPVEHRQSFHSSHLTQPPIPAANKNSKLSIGLDR